MYDVWRMESHSVTVFVEMPQSFEMDVTSRMDPMRPAMSWRKVSKILAFLMFRS